MSTSELEPELEPEPPLGNKDDLEDSYNEEEDEDFNPDSPRGHTGNVSDVSDNEGDYSDSESESESGDEYGTGNYAQIESETGGLVKTRRARLQEAEEERDRLRRKRQYDDELQRSEGISSSVASIWEELQSEANKRLKKGFGANDSVLADRNVQDSFSDDSGDIPPGTKRPLQQEKIVIDRTYRFAGESIHEHKVVNKYSAEGQEYLKNLTLQDQKRQQQQQQQEQGTKGGIHDRGETSHTEEQLIKHSKQGHSDGTALKLRRPLRRPPILEKIIAGSLKPKLNTLEKSKLDWVKYVDEEGITDELALHNKDGYLAKQDFLSAVEANKEKKYRDFRRKQLALRFQQEQR